MVKINKLAWLIPFPLISWIWHLGQVALLVLPLVIVFESQSSQRYFPHAHVSIPYRSLREIVQHQYLCLSVYLWLSMTIPLLPPYPLLCESMLLVVLLQLLNIVCLYLCLMNHIKASVPLIVCPHSVFHCMTIKPMFLLNLAELQSGVQIVHYKRFGSSVSN